MTHLLSIFLYITGVLAWLEQPAMRHATVTVELRDAATGHVVLEHESERAVQPASVMKLVTTAAALRLCGPDARVATTVSVVGSVSDGVLRGDVIVRGSGNAMLGSMWSNEPRDAFARAVVAALRREGIERIDGRVVGDGTWATGNPIPSEWTWEDMGNHYAPAFSGLCYGDNRVTLTFDTSVRGRQPRLVTVEPEVPGLTFDNQLSARSSTADSAYIYGAPGEPRRVVRGAIPQRGGRFSIRGDVHDPALLCASQVRRAIIAAGIDVTGEAASEPSPAGTRTVYTHRGEPLAYVARQTNVNSLNLMAEMLLRQVGSGDEDAGVRAVVDYWRSRGLDTDGIRMHDGCGLAPADRLTARFVTSLLCEMQADEAFCGSLAVAGRTGTVHQFLKGTRLEGRAQLKTGTTRAVIAYAGYVVGSDGRRYAVAVFVNNFNGPAIAVRRGVEQLLLDIVP